MWWIRATVRSQMKVVVELPNGEEQTIDWKSDRAVFEEGDPIKIRDLRMRENYLVVIKAGTGSPGAQQAQQAGAQSLYNDKAIDREAFLDSIEYPGRQAITSRMRDRELEDIKAKAEGKALGVSVGEQIKQEKPGRRPKV